MKSISFYISLLVLWCCASCTAYKQNILFQIDESDFQNLSTQAAVAQEEYIIQVFDKLEISVFTNKGEQLIDPNHALERSSDAKNEVIQYTVNTEGKAELPMLGATSLAGLTLKEANQSLAQAYQSYYKDPFVITRFANKRVVVLGASTNKVVPLDNQGMNLLEVLALSGDLTSTGKSNNIRLIRGDLSNPEVFVIDLSTIEGMRQANLTILPDDIIYIEPAKRPFAALRDFTPILGAITSVLALIVALNR